MRCSEDFFQDSSIPQARKSAIALSLADVAGSTKRPKSI
jgi:hypothetical protein